MPDASCITCRHPAHAQRCEHIKFCHCDTKAPGLHRIGPGPWDYVYNPARNQRVSFVGRDGKMFTGTITKFTEDKTTGEINLTVE